MNITTLRTTSDCPDINTCPSEHVVDTDPRNLYVISKIVTVSERTVFALRPGEVAGWMPAGFLPHGHPAICDLVDPALSPDRQYVVTTAVTDPATLRRFGRLIAADEQLGTVPAPVAVSHA